MGEPAFFSLSEARVFMIAERFPIGFYVKGTLVGDRFIAETEVLGRGELGRDGIFGWLELPHGTFRPSATGRPPHRPYIEGYLTLAGFIPKSRDVFY